MTMDEGNAMKQENVDPIARREEVLVEEIGGECVIYDPASQQAHRLNPTAAVVWEHCDGTRSADDLREIVSERFEVAEPRTVVDMALMELSAAGLLEGGTPEAESWESEERRPQGQGGLNRRDALKRIGGVGAAAALLPLVTTVMAPTPAMARSNNHGSSGGNGSTSGSGYWWCDPDHPDYSSWLANLARSLTGC